MLPPPTPFLHHHLHRHHPPSPPVNYQAVPTSCPRAVIIAIRTITIIAIITLPFPTTRQFRPVAPEQPAERKFRPVVEQRQQEVMLQDVCNCLHISYVSMYALPATTSSQRRFIHAVLASHLWCKCVKTCLESNSDGNSSGETGRTPSSTTSG